MSCTKWSLGCIANKEVVSTESIVSRKVILIWATQGSITQITSVVLTRTFQTDWLKITFLGEAETLVKLSIKSQFGDLGLAQVTPFGDCCFFFFNMGQRNPESVVRKEDKPQPGEHWESGCHGNHLYRAGDVGSSPTDRRMM